MTCIARSFSRLEQRMYHQAICGVTLCQHAVPHWNFVALAELAAEADEESEAEEKKRQKRRKKTSK
jgi:hypothetical protein